MSRSHPFALHRVALVAAVALLALLATLALSGPPWLQRAYYPLQYRDVIAKASVRHGVDPYLLTAVVKAESGFDPQIVSKAGAVGLMQVMPETASDMLSKTTTHTKLTRAELAEPGRNVDIGATYLAYLLGRYGDEATALAAYNAGYVNADQWSKHAGAADLLSRIEFPATRAYVVKVLKDRETYARLYPEAYPAWRGR